MLESLIYVRHGQSIENLLYHLVEKGVLYSYKYPPLWAGMKNGHHPLTTIGQHQIRLARAWMRENGIDWDFAYCSSFVRAVETAQIIDPDEEWIIDPRLSEISVSDLYAASGVWDWFQDINQRHAGQRIAIVGHGYWSIRLRQKIEGWSEEFVKELGFNLNGLHNGGILQYEFRKNRFRLVCPHKPGAVNEKWQPIGGCYGEG